MPAGALALKYSSSSSSSSSIVLSDTVAKLLQGRFYTVVIMRQWMQFSTLLTTIAQTTVIKACCGRH